MLAADNTKFIDPLGHMPQGSGLMASGADGGVWVQEGYEYAMCLMLLNLGICKDECCPSDSWLFKMGPDKTPIPNTGPRGGGTTDPRRGGSTPRHPPQRDREHK